MKLLNFFKDKHGQIVIFQRPNAPLIGWFIFAILNLLWGDSPPKAHHVLHMISFGFIFTWAWLEITDGVNYFRRALGLLILIIVVSLMI